MTMAFPLLLLIVVALLVMVALTSLKRKDRRFDQSDTLPTRAAAFAAHKEIENHRRELLAVRESLETEATSAMRLDREDLARGCLIMQVEIDDQIAALDRKSREIDGRLESLKELVTRDRLDERRSLQRRPDTERPPSLQLIEHRIEKARESIDALTVASRIASKPRGLDDLTNLSREVLVEDRLTEIRQATATKVYTHVR